MAQALGERFKVEARAYGTPSFDIFGTGNPEYTVRYKHNYDPVGLLDRGAQTSTSPSWWPHSYQGYEVRSNETVSSKKRHGGRGDRGTTPAGGRT